MKKISEFKPTTTGIQGHELLAAVDLNRPNAADRNIKPTINQIRDYIAGGIPLPPPDTEWVTMPTVTNTGFVFDVDGAGVANFPSTQGQTFAATSYTVPAAGADLQYVFLIYANPDGTYGTVSGPQSQNPATPPYPADALYVSHAIVSETAGEIQDPPNYVTLTQVQALLGDYLHKNGAAFQTVSTGQGVILESTGAFEADAITWGQYFDPYELTTHRERRNSSNALVSGFYGNRFKEKGWQGVGLFQGVMPTGVTQETEWEYSYDTLVSGNKTTYSGHFASDTKSGLLIVTHDGTTTTTFELSDKIYLNGTAFTGGSSTPLYTTRGQQTDGAPTNKLLDDELKKLEPTTSTLTLASGSVTVPMSKDNFYTIASQPTTISVDISTNVLGAGVVVKFPANGTAEPTVNGAFKHANSGAFKATTGTTNHLRLFCEPNVTGAKTNYYIWT